jgi:hypothetical protein
VVTLPTGLDLIGYFIVRKAYLFNLPFCPNCRPDMFRLSPVRLGGDLAIFGGASSAFLDSLPPIPPDMAMEKNRSWLQRVFRWPQD